MADPQTIRPDTPSAIKASMTLAVASTSTDMSSRNWVVTAGNTPCQLTLGLMVCLLWLRWVRAWRR